MVVSGCRVKWPGLSSGKLLWERGSPSFTRKTGRRLKRRRLHVQRSPRPGPGQVAGILDRDTPEFVAGGDKEGFEFRAPEGAIGDHVSGDRDGLEEFSRRGEDVDTGPVFVAGLHRGLGKIEFYTAELPIFAVGCTVLSFSLTP